MKIGNLAMYMFQIKCLYLVICMFIPLYRLDANTQGTLNTPDDAYRYAKGQKLYLQPYNEDGTSSRISKLNQPLDFAAVTDHAELLGEVRLCLDPQAQNIMVCNAGHIETFQTFLFLYERKS